MKIKNNKGFTLLEVLVAIFIFTTAIFIGYKIIDKSTIAVKDQGNINKGQLTINDMNNYLTKDLEQSETVELNFSREIKKINSEETYSTNNQNLDKLNEEYTNFVNDSSKSKLIQYTYTIKTKNDIDKTSFGDKKIVAEYRTVVEYKENKYKYTISRIDYNNIRIDFMDNEILNKSNQPPFIIKGGYPYEVSAQYNGKDNRIIKHEFSVVSRYNISIENGGGSNGGNENQPWEPIIPILRPPKPDEIPIPPISDNYSAIGFWTADKSKYTINNLYTWVMDKNKKYADKYASQDERNEDEFNISTDNGEGNNGIANSFIGYKSENNNLTEARLSSVSLDRSNEIKKIIIYVSPNTTLSQFLIKFKHGNFNGINGISEESDGTYILNGKECGSFYEILFNPHSNGRANFDIVGKLKIDKDTNSSNFKVDSGYAIVYLN